MRMAWQREKFDDRDKDNLNSLCTGKAELNSGQQCIGCPYVGRMKLNNSTNKTENEERDKSGLVGMEMRV